jgi:hypothetical protein
MAYSVSNYKDPFQIVLKYSNDRRGLGTPIESVEFLKIYSKVLILSKTCFMLASHALIGHQLRIDEFLQEEGIVDKIDSWFGKKKLKRVERMLQSPFLGSVSFRPLSMKSSPNELITDDLIYHLASIRISSLDLARCPYVTHNTLSHLTQFKKLTHLDLSGSTCSSHNLILSVVKLKQLTYLNLSFTQITDTELPFLPHLTNLTSLNLSECQQIKGDGIWHLSKLKNLTVLNLSQCTFNEVGFSHCQNFLRLKAFSLPKRMSPPDDSGKNSSKGDQSRSRRSDK